MVNSGPHLNDHWILTLIIAIPWVLLVVIASGCIIMSVPIAVRLWQRRQLLRSDFELLELTPPHYSEKTLLATNRLLSTVHELIAPHSMIDRLLRRQAPISLEVVSSRSQGIRYMLYVTHDNAAIIKRDIIAYLPGTRCVRVKNYMDSLTKQHTKRVIEFRQTGHPSRPLNVHDDLNQHDPIAYMTGAMTQLKPKELIVFQMLLAPMRGSWIRKNIRKASEERALSNTKRGLLTSIPRFVLRIVRQIIIIFRVMVLDAPRHEQRVSVATHDTETTNSELFAAMQDKLTQPLLRVNIRALIVSGDITGLEQRQRALESSLASFDRSSYQALRRRRHWLQTMTRQSYLNNLQSAYLQCCQIVVLFYQRAKWLLCTIFHMAQLLRQKI